MAIHFYENEKIFMLQGKETSYAFQINEKGYLCHLHWGGKVSDPCDLPKIEELIQRVSMVGRKSSPMEILEYRPFGGASVKEPALKITFPDGTRNLFLHYKSHTIDGNILRVTTREIQYGVEVTMCYRLCEEFDIIERWNEIRNCSDESFNIEIAAGATWMLPVRWTVCTPLFTAQPARK